MANDADFYRARADTEWANAASATLDNVRDRSERAARAWAQMAARSQHIHDQRIEREASAASARASGLPVPANADDADGDDLDMAED